MRGARFRDLVRRHVLACFFVLAYALSWADWLPMALAGKRVGTFPGGPTHLLGLLGPMIAALLVASITGGPAKLRELAARMIRIPKIWAVVLVVLELRARRHHQPSVIGASALAQE